VPIGAILGIGFFSATSTMVMTHARGVIPERLIGRGIATINTFVMLGVACMQTFSSTIVGAFEPLADGARTETARPVRSAHRGADRRRRDLQPLAGRQAQRRNARPSAIATLITINVQCDLMLYRAARRGAVPVSVRDPGSTSLSGSHLSWRLATLAALRRTKGLGNHSGGGLRFGIGRRFDWGR
jgi:hypothetical protein